MPLLPAAPLLVIGLDGATFDVIDPLVSRGQLPTLGRLIASGIRTELRSTLPSATMPAWTSFLTGTSPAHHGITDLFMHGREHTLLPADGRLRSGPTYLARLSARGLRVAALGIPGTWPPERIRGVCIAGFDAPGADRAVGDALWPPDLADDLARFGGWRYAAFNEQRGGRRHLPGALAALLADLERKERIALHILHRGPWDVFALHLQASDTAGHHFWHTWDPSSPRHRTDPELDDALPRVYRRLDTLVGRLMAAAPQQTRVLVVSDHGMGGASDVAVHLNRWLADAGWLRFRHARVATAAGHVVRWGIARAPVPLVAAASRFLPESLTGRLLPLARGLPVDYGQSDAFSDELDYAPSIWLNRRSIFATGTLDDSTADRLTERIRQSLFELRAPQSGEPLLASVLTRRELARGGPHAARYPDLLVVPAWPGGHRPSFLPTRRGDRAVETLSGKQLDGARGWGLPGTHRREGVFLAWGPDLLAREIPTLDIEQGGALIYPLLGQSIPEPIETPLPEWLQRVIPYERGAEASDVDAIARSSQQRSDLTVTRRLEALGYL